MYKNKNKKEKKEKKEKDRVQVRKSTKKCAMSHQDRGHGKGSQQVLNKINTSYDRVDSTHCTNILDH